MNIFMYMVSGLLFLMASTVVSLAESSIHEILAVGIFLCSIMMFCGGTLCTFLGNILEELEHKNDQLESMRYTAEKRERRNKRKPTSPPPPPIDKERMMKGV